MKKIVILLLYLFISVSYSTLLAQHQSFLGIELGGNPELFKYELKKRGFVENEDKYDGGFYGKYLGVPCRLAVHERNGKVEKVFIRYRHGSDFSQEEATSIADGVVMIICSELDADKIDYDVIKDVPILGTCKGTEILLCNGEYEVFTDGLWTDLYHDWEVGIFVVDIPNHPIYEARKEMQKSTQTKQTKKRKNGRKGKKK